VGEAIPGMKPRSAMPRQLNHGINMHESFIAFKWADRIESSDKKGRMLQSDWSPGADSLLYRDARLRGKTYLVITSRRRPIKGLNHEEDTRASGH